MTNAGSHSMASGLQSAIMMHSSIWKQLYLHSQLSLSSCSPVMLFGSTSITAAAQRCNCIRHHSCIHNIGFSANQISTGHDLV